MPDVIDRPILPDADLYEADFYAWTQAQAQKLRDHSANAIDWDNLAEEIESVGRSEKREIRSRLEKVLMHLLKWEFQSAKRTQSWISTLSEQRRQIQLTIDDSPSLGSFPAKLLDQTYEWSRREAAKETGMPLKTFPETCPYSIEDVLDDSFMPGIPWSTEDLIRD
jgi:hypothetical protein